MARKKPTKKIKKQKISQKRIAFIKLPIKQIFHFIFILALLCAFYIFFKNSSYFNLTDIKIIDSQRVSELNEKAFFKLYKGRNIFDVDVKFISDRIKNDFPVIKEAHVTRVLPNRLEIEIIPRVAAALVKSNGHFPVDRSGVVLPSRMESEDLPVITGLSYLFLPRAGEKLNNPQLESAFLLLDALRKNNIMRDYKVTAIDASNHKNLSFYLANSIEVKIGDEGFPEKLKMLKMALARKDLDKDSIKYIDLRFRDIVIGPK